MAPALLIRGAQEPKPLPQLLAGIPTPPALHGRFDRPRALRPVTLPRTWRRAGLSADWARRQRYLHPLHDTRPGHARLRRCRWAFLAATGAGSSSATMSSWGSARFMRSASATACTRSRFAVIRAKAFA